MTREELKALHETLRVLSAESDNHDVIHHSWHLAQAIHETLFPNLYIEGMSFSGCSDCPPRPLDFVEPVGSVWVWP